MLKVVSEHCMTRDWANCKNEAHVGQWEKKLIPCRKVHPRKKQNPKAANTVARSKLAKNVKAGMIVALSADKVEDIEEEDIEEEDSKQQHPGSSNSLEEVVEPDPDADTNARWWAARVIRKPWEHTGNFNRVQDELTYNFYDLKFYIGAKYMAVSISDWAGVR